MECLGKTCTGTGLTRHIPKIDSDWRVFYLGKRKTDGVCRGIRTARFDISIWPSLRISIESYYDCRICHFRCGRAVDVIFSSRISDECFIANFRHITISLSFYLRTFYTDGEGGIL